MKNFVTYFLILAGISTMLLLGAGKGYVQNVSVSNTAATTYLYPVKQNNNSFFTAYNKVVIEQGIYSIAFEDDSTKILFFLVFLMGCLRLFNTNDPLKIGLYGLWIYQMLKKRKYLLYHAIKIPSLLN